MRVRDFQIWNSPWPSLKETRAITTPRCLATGETVRQWLRSRRPRIEAPFVKLLVELYESSGPASDREGSVIECLGICTATVVEPFEGILGDEHEAHKVLVEAVLRALGHVKREMQWDSPELQAFVESLRGKSPPLEHCFDKLTKTDRQSKRRFETWLLISAHETRVEVRVMESNGTKAARHAVFRRAGPQYIEDVFGARSAIIQNGNYVLRDRDKQELARVPVS